MLKLGEGALGWSTQVTRWPALGHTIHTKLHNNTLRYQTITLHYTLSLTTRTFYTITHYILHYHSTHTTISLTTAYYTITHYILHYHSLHTTISLTTYYTILLHTTLLHYTITTTLLHTTLHYCTQHYRTQHYDIQHATSVTTQHH